MNQPPNIQPSDEPEQNGLTKDVRKALDSKWVNTGLPGAIAINRWDFRY